MRQFVRLALLLGCTALPLAAQGGAGRDSARTRRAPDGVVLDFVDQDVSVVLRAIAEAGGLSVTLSNIPQARVSLRLQQQLTRDGALDALRAVAEGSDISMTEGSTVIRLVGPPPAPEPAARVSAEDRALNLYTVRLKHTTATAIAPLLMNLLTGTGSVAGRRARGAAAPSAASRASSRATRGGVPMGRSEGPGIAMVPPASPQVAIRDALGQAFGFQTSAPSGALAFSDIRIVADELTNSLIVRATEEDFNAVQQLVQTVDLRPLQVLIEVTIAQVERNSDLNLGVSGVPPATGAPTRATRSRCLPGAGTARDFVFMLTGGKGSVDYDIALNALQTRGDVKVLALPIIIAQNNREVGAQRGLAACPSCRSRRRAALIRTRACRPCSTCPWASSSPSRPRSTPMAT